MFDVTDGTAEESVDELAALAAVARQAEIRYQSKGSLARYTSQ